jgi:hypothetical protein
MVFHFVNKLLMVSMKNILFLCVCLLCSSCATEPTPATTSSKQTLTNEETKPPLLENLKIGMPHVEAERILGNLTSVTDTATGTTAVWVFGPGSSKAAPPPEPKGYSGIFSGIGSIGATAIGIFSPIAGRVLSMGSQVYSAINSGNEKTTPSIQTAEDNTRIVTIEFRENKVFSIQRARPTAVPSPSSQ